MIIQLSPQRRDTPITSLAVAGDVLTINGEAFDFGPLPEGATLPAGSVACELIIGAVTREDGQVKLTLVLPHGPSPDHATAFPDDIVSPGDGPVTLPGQTWIADEEGARAAAEAAGQGAEVVNG